MRRRQIVQSYEKEEVNIEKQIISREEAIKMVFDTLLEAEMLPGIYLISPFKIERMSAGWCPKCLKHIGKGAKGHIMYCEGDNE